MGDVGFVLRGNRCKRNRRDRIMEGGLFVFKWGGRELGRMYGAYSFFFF